MYLFSFFYKENLPKKINNFNQTCFCLVFFADSRTNLGKSFVTLKFKIIY